MSRVRNPNEKKRLSLTKDHRTLALEGNKTLRSAWPAKKARSNRRFRHASAIAIAKTARTDPSDTPASVTTQPKRSLKKFGVLSLAQSMAVKKDDTGLRWNLDVLESNPKTLEIAVHRIKPRYK